VSLYTPPCLAFRRFFLSLCREFSKLSGKSIRRHFAKPKGRPLTDIISPQNPLVKAALYYIRLDTHNNSALFKGDVAGSENSSESKAVSATSFSQIAADELQAAAKRKGITLNQWAIAPDAIYALVCIYESRPDQEHRFGKPRALSAFVAGVKAATAKRINLVRNQPGCPVWQRSYREQRINDDRTLARLVKQMEMVESKVSQ